MATLTSFLTTLLIMYLMLCVAMFAFQRKLMYHPEKSMAGPENYGLTGVEEISLKTVDDKNIVAWIKKPKAGKPWMVYYHGNAGNLGDRVDKLTPFLEKGYGLLAVSYRGYGHSEGEPTEDGLYNDGRAALEYLKKKKINFKNNVIIYGESLGSGVAVQMATENEFKAIILEAPYTSIANRGAEVYKFMPVRLLLKDRFRNIKKIKNVHSPVLIFHGFLDEVMPIHHGHAMLEAANEPKLGHFYENVGHTDFNYSVLADETDRFIRK